MRDLQSCSGPWRGFWLQHRLRGNMRITLSFNSGKISGMGVDLIGPFSIQGSFGVDNVDFVKRYTSHPVEYSGRWDGQVIHGKWEIRRIDEVGEFEIWPESDEISMETLTSEVREPAAV